MNTKLVRLKSGEDIICDLITEDDNTITAENVIVAVPQGQGMDTNVSSQNSQLFCQLIPSPIQYSSVCSITSPLSCESFLKATSSSPRLPLSDAPSEHDTTSYRISEVDVSDDAIMNMWNECEITPFGRGVFRNAKTA